MDKTSEQILSDFNKSLSKTFITTKEVSAALKIVLDVVREIKTEIKENNKTQDTKNNKISANFIKRIEGIESEIGIVSNSVGKIKLEEVKIQLGREIENIRKLIPDLIDFENKFENRFREIERKILSIPEELKAEKIRDKIESLKGNARTDKNAIKGIEEIEKDIEELFSEIKKLKNIKGGSSGINAGGSPGGGGRVVKAYDLSSVLNGVTKVFAIPAFWRIISVHASSSPGILRPTVDFTSSSGQITFTSEINADSTLASGQTVIILYAEI